MKISIDWSHTKGLTTFDGKKVRVENRKTLITRLRKGGNAGGESSSTLQSTCVVHSPVAIIEQGCPLSLLYELVLSGASVFTISNRATEDYRTEHGIEKSDEADARIIWELSQNGATLNSVTLDNKLLQMKDAYHQYCRFQKARVAMENMRRAHKRHYGAGESKMYIKARQGIHSASDLTPYDIAVDVLKAREKTLIKKVEQIGKDMPLLNMAGGESNDRVSSSGNLHPPTIKGLGSRLWWGIIVTGNPGHFPCLSAYLRFCGLTGDAVKSHKYNRHARMLYHMLAEETMKHKDPVFRPIYDTFKVDIANSHPDYTKMHLHNATLNRVSTFLAKHIFYHCRNGQRE